MQTEKTGKRRLGFLERILPEICVELGLHLTFFDDLNRVGSIHNSNGKKLLFKGTSFDINGLGASRIADDKDYCAQVLGKHGIRAAPGLLLLSPRQSEKLQAFNAENKLNAEFPEEAFSFAESHGYPMYLKPNDAAEGEGVQAVHSDKQLISHLNFLFQKFDAGLLQPSIAGRDYRVVVLNGDVKLAYMRKPLAVTGDGTSDIKTLLNNHLQKLKEDGRPILKSKLLDATEVYLAGIGLSFAHVPKHGQDVRLLNNANMSTGGLMEDCTAVIDDRYRDVCIQAVSAIGLNFAGVDLICKEISMFDEDHAVLEINASPGLHNYAAAGGDAFTRVKQIYHELLASALT